MEDVVIIALKDRFAGHALPELAGCVSHPVKSLTRMVSTLEQYGWGGERGRNGLHGQLTALLTKPEGQVAVLEVTDFRAFGRSVQGMLTPFIYDRIDLPRPMARLIPVRGVSI